jgi:cytochrome c-type biogenesis protein
MISGTVALAFTAGMVATFNPCGFALLPAYIGAFVAGDEVSERTDQRVLGAIRVAAAVSVGFIIVFASVGLIIDRIAGEARRQLPWVTIVIGALLIVAGIAMAIGWKPTLAIRGPQFAVGSNQPRVMVGYGITYAIASLSCTIGPFLAVTGAALSQSPIEALGTYVAYALGMGVVILILSIASALAHTTVVNHMRRLSQIAPRVGGALMVLAGTYAIWYGRWELAVYDGDLGTDPLIDFMEAVRLWFVDSIQAVGAQRLAALTAIGIAAVITATRLTRTPSRPTDPVTTGPDHKS